MHRKGEVKQHFLTLLGKSWGQLTPWFPWFLDHAVWAPNSLILVWVLVLKTNSFSSVLASICDISTNDVLWLTWAYLTDSVAWVTSASTCHRALTTRHRPTPDETLQAMLSIFQDTELAIRNTSDLERLKSDRWNWDEQPAAPDKRCGSLALLEEVVAETATVATHSDCQANPAAVNYQHKQTQ